MSHSILPQTFYVYAHRKATTGAVFYIGKGTGKRAWRNEARNDLWVKTVEKHGVIVEVVHEFMDEGLAFELERELIAYYGRINTRSGALVNMTDGGEGTSGQIQSAQKRAKLKAFRTGMKMAPEFVEACRDRMLKFRHTDESRAKISAAHKGKTISPEHIEAVRRANLGRKKTSEFMALVSRQVICLTTGQEIASQQMAAAWVRSTGAACSQGGISNCCNGRSKTTAGYRFAFVPPSDSIAVEHLRESTS